MDVLGVILMIAAVALTGTGTLSFKAAMVLLAIGFVIYVIGSRKQAKRRALAHRQRIKSMTDEEFDAYCKEQDKNAKWLDSHYEHERQSMSLTAQHELDNVWYQPDGPDSRF